MTHPAGWDPALPYAPLDFSHPFEVPGAAVDGAALVAELPPAHAREAWEALRTLRAWAHGPDAAGDLFHLGALRDWEREVLLPPGEGGLWTAVAGLAVELRRPSHTDPARVAQACLAAADWALAHDAPATARAFAEAAALAWPTNAGLAWMAGKILRNAGCMREAEFWLERAHRVAVFNKDREVQYLCLHSLGNCYRKQGKFEQARRTLEKSLRTIRRYHLPDREGQVLHDLFIISAEGSPEKESEALAGRALRAYGIQHPNLRALCHDVAQFWMNLGYYRRALPVLRSLLPLFPVPHERLRVMAAFAHAAGACGEREEFGRMLEEIRHVVPALTDDSPVAACLLETGLGAACLSLWECAADCLKAASQSARRYGESDLVIRSDKALESVRQREHLEVVREPRGGTRPHSATHPLTRELVQSLAGAALHTEESSERDRPV